MFHKYRVICPHCETALLVTEDLMGTEGNCPACHERFSLPELESSTPQAVPEFETDSDTELGADLNADAQDEFQSLVSNFQTEYAERFEEGNQTDIVPPPSPPSRESVSNPNMSVPHQAESVPAFAAVPVEFAAPAEQIQNQAASHHVSIEQTAPKYISPISPPISPPKSDRKKTANLKGDLGDNSRRVETPPPLAMHEVGFETPADDAMSARQFKIPKRTAILFLTQVLRGGAFMMALVGCVILISTIFAATMGSHPGTIPVLISVGLGVLIGCSSIVLLTLAELVLIFASQDEMVRHIVNELRNQSAKVGSIQQETTN